MRFCEADGLSPKELHLARIHRLAKDEPDGEA